MKAREENSASGHYSELFPPGIDFSNCHDRVQTISSFPIFNQFTDKNQMISSFTRLILKLWGFSVHGDPGKDIAKKVFVVIPHTSNWDFPLGILVRSAYRIDVGFVAKDSLFRPPFGFFFRWLGGYPVNRSTSSNYVEKVVKIYQKHPRMSIAIAPEGTRTKVDKLRSGFYHIARLAGIPMILTRFDFGRKEVVFSEPLMASGDQEADFQQIFQFFKGAIGKIPENGFTID